MEDRKENNYYEMIVPYLDDELTVGEKELFEKALENDEELQAEFGRIADVRTALLYANAPEPPQGLEDEIISSIRSKKKFTPASSAAGPGVGATTVTSAPAASRPRARRSATAPAPTTSTRWPDNFNMTG